MANWMVFNRWDLSCLCTLLYFSLLLNDNSEIADDSVLQHIDISISTYYVLSVTSYPGSVLESDCKNVKYQYWNFYVLTNNYNSNLKLISVTV